MMLHCLIAAAKANIGETQDQIAARYGSGKVSEFTMGYRNSAAFAYTTDGYEITVIFRAGKSIAEMYDHKGVEVPEAEIKEALKVYSVGHSWKSSNNDRWWRADKKMEAHRVDQRKDCYVISWMTTM
ncbi:hypothetical protein [Chthoniobacter sp.]|uniref:hypothetical protein n=1 Tax=Chthoniobacter sp. TaxID=2510640 RepID=UPI0032AFBA27